MKRATPLTAIRHKCRDCCCGSVKAVRFCPARPGTLRLPPSLRREYPPRLAGKQTAGFLSRFRHLVRTMQVKVVVLFGPTPGGGRQPNSRHVLLETEPKAQSVGGAGTPASLERQTELCTACSARACLVFS